MWKFAIILLFSVLSVHAEEEQPKIDPKPSSLLETAFCYIAPKPWSCVRLQAARTLDYWQTKVESKRIELLAEADEEMKESESSRGMQDDEEKNELPSQIINSLDKGFSTLANLVTDEVRNFKRDGRSLKSDVGESKQLDDINDFNSDAIVNDDSSVLQKFSMMEEGNVTEEARGKELNKAYKQGNKQGYGGYEDDGFYGYGYKSGKGKKGKKGKKGLMKLFFLGAVIKSKVEMLLKVLSFHLQLKFFAIALINMVINLARFWIDLKKQPQKVVYVEHAQHQHHYDHDDHEFGNWKRNTNTQGQQQEYNGDFAHRYAYNSYPGAAQTY